MHPALIAIYCALFKEPYLGPIHSSRRVGARTPLCYFFAWPHTHMLSDFPSRRPTFPFVAVFLPLWTDELVKRRPNAIPMSRARCSVVSSSWPRARSWSRSRAGVVHPFSRLSPLILGPAAGRPAAIPSIWMDGWAPRNAPLEHYLADPRQSLHKQARRLPYAPKEEPLQTRKTWCEDAFS